MQPFLRVLRPDDQKIRHQYQENQAYFANQQELQFVDLKLLGELGEHARILGELEASRHYLERALALAREYEDHGRIVANLIRLGTTLQYLNEHSAGEALMREALTLTDQPATCHYHDFALQHLGKLLVETGATKEARTLFEQALILRQQKGEAGLIASTQQALDSLNARETQE